jgi:hypothetical protein
MSSAAVGDCWPVGGDWLTGGDWPAGITAPSAAVGDCSAESKRSKKISLIHHSYMGLYGGRESASLHAYEQRCVRQWF